MKVLATPGLGRLQLGWAASSIAGWAFMVALSVYAYDRGGAAAVGLAAVVRMVPAGLASPVASLLADRFPRRTVLVVACAARAALAVAVALAAAADAPLAVVLALAALLTVAGTAHRPAQAALLPSLARTPDELAAANGVWSAVDNAGFLVGALGAGVAIAATSAAATFAAVAVGYAVAAVVFARLPRDEVAEHRAAGSDSGTTRELLLGLRAIRDDAGLRVVAVMVTATVFAEGAVDVLVVVLALSVLDIGSAGVGVLNAAWGAGGLLGGAVAMALLGRGRLAGAFAAGSALAGAALLVVAAVPAAGVAVASFAVLGLGYALLEVGGLTFLQRLAGDAVLARVFGVLETGYWLATGLGALLAPVLIATVGPLTATAVVGAALLLLAAGRARALGRLRAAHRVPERPFALLRALPVFAPVPIVEVETLAARATGVDVDAGGTVIVQGEPGACFYVVDTGSVDVVRDGVVCASGGPGACFGEAALLRDCPRNATVVARDDVHLYALDRGSFLSVVTGHPHARRAAERVLTVQMEGVPA